MIRPYTNKDKEELVGLLQLNTPLYFAEAEEADFIDYLDNHIESYFVVEENGALVGSGGVNYFPDHTARLSWDVIHPAHQGKGIGKKLTLHRIRHIRQTSSVNTLYVRTTQLVYRFYEKMGFELERTEKDFWAKGFDLYQMKMALNPPSASIRSTQDIA